MAEPREQSSPRVRARHGLAWLLSLLIVVLYVALPDAEREPLEQPRDSAGDDASEDAERLEIRGVSPLEPYPGSSIIITHNGVGDPSALNVYAGRTELRVLARHE